MIFTAAMGFVSFLGYTSICRRPVVFKKLILFRILQSILCVMWLIWSICRAGSFDGWLRITLLKRSTPKGSARFCIFLAILESFGYLASCGIGIFCIIMAGKASEGSLDHKYSPSNRT